MTEHNFSWISEGIFHSGIREIRSETYKEVASGDQWDRESLSVQNGGIHSETTSSGALRTLRKYPGFVMGDNQDTNKDRSWIEPHPEKGTSFTQFAQSSDPGDTSYTYHFLKSMRITSFKIDQIKDSELSGGSLDKTLILNKYT